MKKHPTRHELLTNLLLSQAGYRYLTQVVFGFYIIDFIIPSLLLAIEIDGSSHNSKQDYDARRDQFIISHGLKVIHVKNEDVSSTLLPILSSFPPVPGFLDLFKACKKKACKAHSQAMKKNISQYTDNSKKKP